MRTRMFLVALVLAGPALAQEVQETMEVPLLSELLAGSVNSTEQFLEILRSRSTENYTEAQLAEHEARIAQTEERLEQYTNDQRVAMSAENAMRFRDEALRGTYNSSQTFEQFAEARLARIRNDIAEMRDEGVDERRIGIYERMLAAEEASLAAVRAQL